MYHFGEFWETGHISKTTIWISSQFCFLFMLKHHFFFLNYISFGKLKEIMRGLKFFPCLSHILSLALSFSQLAKSLPHLKALFSFHLFWGGFGFYSGGQLEKQRLFMSWIHIIWGFVSFSFLSLSISTFSFEDFRNVCSKVSVLGISRDSKQQSENTIYLSVDVI